MPKNNERLVSEFNNELKLKGFNVQDKINRVRELAKTPVKGSHANSGRSFRSADSLSHVVRNAKEANVFLEELDVAIRISQKR